MRIKLLFASFVLVTTLLLATETAVACTCSARTVCQYSSDSKTVFVGKVIESNEIFRKVTRRERQIGSDEWKENEYEEQRQVSRLSVEEGFFGTQGNKEIVIETEISSSCGFALAKDVTYLVYASNYNGGENLMTGMCTGPKPVTEAGKDLSYLRENKEANATVQGKAGFGDWGRLDAKPLTKYGVNTVRLIGAREQFDAKIESDGSYKFTNISPGPYNIQLVLPDSLTTIYGYHPDVAEDLDIGDQSRIEVRERGCIVEDFLVRENGRISGRITDEKGVPVEDITVYLVPVRGNGVKIPQEEPCYDTGLCLDAREDGRFLFNGLKAGKYLVGVRMDDYVCNNCVDAEYMKALYPGVPDEKKAVPVTVKFGSLTDEINFKLMRKYREQQIHGKVAFKDRRPAAKVSIRFVARTPDLKENGITFIKTDEQGNFLLDGYEGHSYLIQAFTDSRDGNDYLESNAVVVDIKSGHTLEGLKLVLDKEDEKDCPKCEDFSEFPTKPAITRRPSRSKTPPKR